MGQPNPQAGYETSPSPLKLRDAQEMELRALQEENTQLRELVIQLSKLVVKNVMERR